MAQQTYDPKSDEGIPHKQGDLPNSPLPPSDEGLRHITGIGKDEEKSMEASALRDKESGGLYNPGSGASKGLGSLENLASERGGSTSKAAGTSGMAGVKGLGSKFSAFFAKPGNRKKALIGGGSTAATVTLVVAISSFLSGPLEFIHLSQLMEKFHFANMEDTQDGRLMRLYRYIREPDMPQNTRMGKTGNKIADKLETKMNENGIKSQYTENLGFGDGYAVDLDHEQYKNKNTNDVKKELSEKYGIDEKHLQPGVDSSGKQVLKIDSRALSYRQQVKLNRAILRDAGYSKITAALGSRVMGKRAGLTWHPIKKADQKILEGGAKKYKELRDKWRKQSSDYINEGSGAIRGEATKDTPEDEDGNKDQTKENEADQVKGEIDDISEGAQDANQGVKDGDSDAPKKLESKLSLKIGGGFAALAGVACMIRGMSDNIDQLRQDQVMLPMIRMGMQAMSIGSQVQSNEDISMEQLGIAREDLHEKNKNGKEVSSWNQARSIQAELGQTQNGPDIPDSAKVFGKGNPFDFLDGIGPLNPICSALNSTAGQIISFALSGGPLQALAGLGLDKLLEPVLGAAAQWLAGSPINALATGAERGNYINYGARLAANDQAAAMGGAVLSGSQELALDQASRSVRQDEFQSKSIAYRMFNVDDSQTLISKFIDNNGISNDAAQNITNVASTFDRVFASAIKIPGSLLLKNVRAADKKYDYGFSEYGFSIEDQNNKEVENPYKNAKKAADILDGSDGEKYIDRAKKCFGVEISNSDGWDVSGGDKTTNLYDKEYPDDCSDSSSDWRTIRFFILDTQTIKSVACFEGEDDVCSDLGVNAGGGTSDSSASISGDAQEIAKKILEQANKGKIVFAVLNSADTSDGSTPEANIRDTADGKEAKTTSNCSGRGAQPPDASVALDVNLLKSILAISQNTTVTITALAGQCHTTPSSNHYKGKAVDFGCGFSDSAADAAAKPYNYVATGERCDQGTNHSHYSPDGS